MRSANKFVLCVRNRGYEVSLEPRKLYQVLPDRVALSRGQIRVVDESGEDYLFPKDLFAEIKLPVAIRRAVLAAA
jgi:hypothetical protein